MAASIWTGIVLWALLNICKGSIQDVTVFSSEGQRATLPCHSTSTDCSSVTWMYNSSPVIELVAHGIVTNIPAHSRSKRLTVESNCSLTILNVKPADAGAYTCRVYSGPSTYSDSSVYLAVLNITSSSQLKSVIMNCSLHTSEVCTKHINKDMNLTWLNENGSDLKKGTRYSITKSRCHSTLSVTLDQSDHNRKWMCQLTVDGRRRSSVSHIITISGQAGFPVIGVATLCTVLCAGVCVMIIIITCKRKEKRRELKKTEDHSIPPCQDKVETENVVYADVCVRMDGRQERDRDHIHLDTEYATLKVTP